MSCGQPHDADCSEVLERVYSFIDHELDTADETEIRHHLDECAPCLREFDLEALVKRLVARSCSEPAPRDLRSKVLTRIHNAHVEISETRSS